MALTVLNWSTVLLQLPLSFNHSHRLAMEKPAEGMGGGGVSTPPLLKK